MWIEIRGFDMWIEMWIEIISGKDSKTNPWNQKSLNLDQDS